MKKPQIVFLAFFGLLLALVAYFYFSSDYSIRGLKINAFAKGDKCSVWVENKLPKKFSILAAGIFIKMSSGGEGHEISEYETFEAAPAQNLPQKLSEFEKREFTFALPYDKKYFDGVYIDIAEGEPADFETGKLPPRHSIEFFGRRIQKLSDGSNTAYRVFQTLNFRIAEGGGKYLIVFFVSFGLVFALGAYLYFSSAYSKRRLKIRASADGEKCFLFVENRAKKQISIFATGFFIKRSAISCGKESESFMPIYEIFAAEPAEKLPQTLSYFERFAFTLPMPREPQTFDGVYIDLSEDEPPYPAIDSLSEKYKCKSPGREIQKFSDGTRTAYRILQTSNFR
ncbi:MAG: hypothetical protein J6T16_03570 [Opitutales bacterium]|nr:hypothetical protein [Opitutales bacterium]